MVSGGRGWAARSLAILSTKTCCPHTSHRSHEETQLRNGSFFWGAAVRHRREAPESHLATVGGHVRGVDVSYDGMSPTTSKRPTALSRCSPVIRGRPHFARPVYLTQLTYRGNRSPLRRSGSASALFRLRWPSLASCLGHLHRSVCSRCWDHRGRRSKEGPHFQSDVPPKGKGSSG